MSDDQCSRGHSRYLMVLLSTVEGSDKKKKKRIKDVKKKEKEEKVEISCHRFSFKLCFVDDDESSSHRYSDSSGSYTDAVTVF